MTGFARSHLNHHWRFYACAALGALVYMLCADLPPPVRRLASGDAFFLAYIAIMSFIAARITPEELDAKAEIEDDGIAIVVLVALVMVGFCCFAIITLLHQKGGQGPGPFTLVLAALGAPLGWSMLHMMMAYHYAFLFYSEPGEAAGSGLDFPNCGEPGAADFFYFSFVVGMTAQVSDVQVTSTRLRRATLGHGIVSFFFNAVLIAMAVNGVVAIAA